MTLLDVVLFRRTRDASEEAPARGGKRRARLPWPSPYWLGVASEPDPWWWWSWSWSPTKRGLAWIAPCALKQFGRSRRAACSGRRRGDTPGEWAITVRRPPQASFPAYCLVLLDRSCAAPTRSLGSRASCLALLATSRHARSQVTPLPPTQGRIAPSHARGRAPGRWSSTSSRRSAARG